MGTQTHQHQVPSRDKHGHKDTHIQNWLLSVSDEQIYAQDFRWTEAMVESTYLKCCLRLILE